MRSRFVIVPAVPLDKAPQPIGNPSYAATLCGGFDIYDNQAKERLKPSYPSKADAEAQCQQLNLTAGVG